MDKTPAPSIAAAAELIPVAIQPRLLQAPIKMRILIADDSKATALPVIAFLQQLGYRLGTRKLTASTRNWSC